MTQSDFNHLLTSIKGLSPAQARQLRQQLDRQLDAPAKPPGKVKPPATTAKRAKAAPPPAKKPLTIDELHRQMMADGLILSLPDPALDADDDDPDDQPIAIEGEPLSETILRERR
jgi:plasmid stabilization system protein ParE